MKCYVDTRGQIMKIRLLIPALILPFLSGCPVAHINDNTQLHYDGESLKKLEKQRNDNDNFVKEIKKGH